MGGKWSFAFPVFVPSCSLALISWVSRVTPPAPGLLTWLVPCPFPGSGMLAMLRDEHVGKTPVGFGEGQARRDLGSGRFFSLLSSSSTMPPTQSWGRQLGHSLWTVPVPVGRLEDKSEYLLQPVATIPHPSIILQPSLSPRGCQVNVPAAWWPPGGLLLFLKEYRGWAGV